MSTDKLHFIGVGGVGMSGIARVAHDQGMEVSGSDLKESRYTKQLREAGVTVFIGQDGPRAIPSSWCPRPFWRTTPNSSRRAAEA